jgi:hypothetical protein
MDTYHTETYTNEHTGIAYLVEYWYDSHHGAPDKEFDGHGHILEMGYDPTDPDQLTDEPSDEYAMRAALMRVITKSRHHTYLIYDYITSLNVAMTEWGCKTTEAAVAAVEQDFKYIKGWYDDEWYWIGITVKRADEDDPWHEVEHSVGGFESLIFDDEKGRNEVLADLILELESQIKAEQHKDQLCLPFDTAAVVHLTHYR